MQKPVNSEIDLIRAIYTKSNDLLLEAKAKKLTPKEPDLYSGVAEPAAPVAAAPAAAAAAPKTAKGKSKSTPKAKDTTTERVNIDPMTKKQGNAVFAKPKASVSPAVSSLPTPSFGSSADIINVAAPASSNPQDLNKDGSVVPAEMRAVPASTARTSRPDGVMSNRTYPSQAYMVGQGLGLVGRTIKNVVNTPKAVLGAGILAGILSGKFGMNQQMPANKPVTPITAQSDTPPTSSSFEAPPDPGQRRWTPYNYFTDPKRVAPINEQQEITEYYRQVLAQKLEEASAAFWAVQGAGATRKQLNTAEAQERADKLAPFEKMEPNKYPVKNMPVKDKKEKVESEPLKREDRFQFPNDPVTRNEFTLGRLATATSAPSGPKIQQPLIPSSMLQGLEGRMKAAGQWLAGETKEVLDSSDDYSDGADKDVSSTSNKKIKTVKIGAPLLDSDKRAATEIKNKLMAMKSRRAQPTTQAPKETFDAEGGDMTKELPKLPTISSTRQSQIGSKLEKELAKAHGSVEQPKSHAGDDIDDDTAIDTKLPSIASHAKREDASATRKYGVLEKLYPASSRVSPVGDIAPVSAENPPDNTSLAQLKIDTKAAKQRKSHAALHDIYSDLFAQHAPDVATPKSENLPVEPVSTGRTDVSSTTSWPQLVAQQLAPNWGKAKVPFKDSYLQKPRHQALNALSQVKLHEPHTFAALLPHVDDATKTSLQQHMGYLAKNSARDVETPKSDVGTLLKNISRF